MRKSLLITLAALYLSLSQSYGVIAADASASSKSGAAEQHFAEGEKALSAGEYQKAVDEYTASINDGKKDAKSYGGRALALAYLSKFADSVKDYNRAIALNNSSSEAYYGRGAVYVRMGAHKRAIKDFDKTLKMAPQNADALYSRAGEHAAINKFDKALADYSETVKADPKYLDAYYDHAVAYSNMGEHKKAIEQVNKAIGLDPDAKAERYYVRAVLRLRGADYEASLADLDKVLKLKPTYTDAFMLRGFVWLCLNNAKEAATDFAQFIKSANPDDSNLQYIRVAYYLSRNLARIQGAGPKFIVVGTDKPYKFTPWDLCMTDYLGGLLTRKQVLSKMKGEDQKTAAYCYVGLNELITGSSDGVKQLNWVVQNGNPRFTEYQLAQALLKHRVDIELAPLFLSIRENDLESVKRILRSGIDCKLKNSQGDCAIVEAVIQNNAEIVTLLLEHAAEPNQKLADGRTSLYFAAMNSAYGQQNSAEQAAKAQANKQIIESLLAKGADVNAADKYGITPLMNAVRSNNVEAVKLLLEKNADMNAQVLEDKIDPAGGHTIASKGETALKIAESRVKRREAMNEKDREVLALLQAAVSKSQK